MNLITYLKTKGLKRAFEVIWQYKIPRIQVLAANVVLRHRDLQNVIMIESHNDFDCNGGAFYDYLIEHGYNRNYKIVWFLRHPAPVDLPKNVTAVPLYGPSIRKAYYTCLAKYFLADCVVTNKVRNDQISVYLSHGVFALKNVRGRLSIPSSVDYVLSPSPNVDDVVAWQFSMESSDAKFLHLGFPFLDPLYERKLEQSSATPDVRFRKSILWMPTFREGIAFDRVDSSKHLPYGVPLLEDESAIRSVDSMLGSLNTRLVIKIHPMQDTSAISAIHAKNIVFLTATTCKQMNIRNHDLMAECAALITDYSAAAYEFLALDRPIAFAIPDLDHYKLGLIPNPEEFMPGRVIKSLDELMGFIEEVCAGLDAEEHLRAKVKRSVFQFDEHGSCERLAQFLCLEEAPLAYT